MDVVHRASHVVRDVLDDHVDTMWEYAPLIYVSVLLLCLIFVFNGPRDAVVDVIYLPATLKIDRVA